METGKLQGQSAFITGASGGIGQAIAIAMAKEGASIAVNYHSNDEGAAKTLEQIKAAGGKAILVKGDVAKEDEVLRTFKDAVSQLGTIDILVNNAGIQKDNKLVDMTLEQWNQVIGTNLTGSFLCAREAAKEFYRRGMAAHSKALGKIIFISSVHNVIPWAGHANYVASKGGEDMLMKTLAQELAPDKIRVNSIAPGAIRTDINKKVWSDAVQAKQLNTMIPYGRIGEPGDVANLAVWLASDEADYITGANIFIDGGMTLYPEFAHGG